MRLFDPEGLGAAAGRFKSGSALISPDRQMFSREKKAVFPFILLRLFDPEGLSPFRWVRTLRRCSWTDQKRKRLVQPRQANVSFLPSHRDIKGFMLSNST
ncbi:hypothetical protein ACQCVP_10565 [Rossellomorea vietnamensis]|uniref:hypothetical protein n=1 Tax=Rossellomorea vietnamensis TaxID=218284 RepID=UPI003CF48819